MNDQQNSAQNSYVDDYQPPANNTDKPWPWSPPTAQTTNVSTAPVATPPPVSQPLTPVPTVTETPAPTDLTSGSQTSDSQALEDQNIFVLLGVNDGSDQEKEAFLDELQQVIWEDFLENDVELLITAEENTQLKQIMAKSEVSEADLQEEMIVYLEKLIPDLEDIMLEKAMELKEDMVNERLAGMREYYKDQPTELLKLDQAETLIKEDKWRDAAELMNSLAI